MTPWATGREALSRLVGSATDRQTVGPNVTHTQEGNYIGGTVPARDRKCTKKYPRELRQKTTGDDGYPLYRRRKPGDGGHSQCKTSD
jgi:hypothetical protein